MRDCFGDCSQLKEAQREEGAGRLARLYVSMGMELANDCGRVIKRRHRSNQNLHGKWFERELEDDLASFFSFTDCCKQLAGETGGSPHLSNRHSYKVGLTDFERRNGLIVVYDRH